MRSKPVWRSVVRLFFNRFHFLAGYVLTLALCWQYPELSLGLNAVGFSLLWLALALHSFCDRGLCLETVPGASGKRPHIPRHPPFSKGEAQ